MGVLERVQTFRRMGPFLVKTVTSEPSEHSTSNVFGTGAKVAGREQPSLSHPCSLCPPHLPACSHLSAGEEELMLLSNL